MQLNPENRENGTFQVSFHRAWGEWLFCMILLHAVVINTMG